MQFRGREAGSKRGSAPHRISKIGDQKQTLEAPKAPRKVETKEHRMHRFRRVLQFFGKSMDRNGIK